MSMLQASIRKTGPLAAKIDRIRAERIAAGLLQPNEPEHKKTVVLISQNGRKLVEEVAPDKPTQPRRLIRRLASYDIKSVKLNDVVYPTISEIQAATCEYFGVDRVDLISHRRTPAIIVPRHVAVYLCKQLTLHSYPVIAKQFSGRDHSTAIASVQRIEFLMVKDREFEKKVHELKAIIKRRVEGVTHDL
jgi:hypothetical protein